MVLVRSSEGHKAISLNFLKKNPPRVFIVYFDGSINRHFHGQLICELRVSREQNFLPSPPLPFPFSSLPFPSFLYLLSLPSLKVSLHFKICYWSYFIFNFTLSWLIQSKVPGNPQEIPITSFAGLLLISLFMTAKLVIYFSTIYITE